MSITTPSRSRAVRPFVVGLVVASLLASIPVPALASKITDKQKQAAAVQRQIDALDMKASIADEDYNEARARLSDASAKARTAAARVKALAARKATLQAALAGRADTMYRSGGTLGTLALILGSRNVSEFLWTSQVLDRLSEQDAANVRELKRNEIDARATAATLSASKAQAAKAEKTIAAKARTVRAQLAERQRVLDGLDADIRDLLAKEAARKAAAARARYLAYLRAHSKPPKKPAGGKTWLDLGGNPPSSARAATAVAWAKKALGRRYVWAASGPMTFDCSGLTMWAYSHAGVRLPHSSRAQINYGRRVSRANLQPGDLVFFYSPIHHVGMYVGGGYFIHAPGTGRTVQYASLAGYGRFAGACRP